jgi:hypothetical protein
MHQSIQGARHFELGHQLSASLALVGNSRPPIPNHLATRMASGRSLDNRGIGRSCKSRVLGRPLARAHRPLRRLRRFTCIMSTTPLHTSRSLRTRSHFSAHRVYVPCRSRLCLERLRPRHQLHHHSLPQLHPLSPPKAQARQYQEDRSSLAMHWRDIRLHISFV